MKFGFSHLKLRKLSFFAENFQIRGPCPPDPLPTPMAPILTDGHESWATTEKVMSKVQRKRWDFAKSSRQENVRSCALRKTMNVEPS